MHAGLDKWLKDGLDFFLGDAHAGVLHLKQQRDMAARFRFLPLHPDIDSTVIGEFDRVAREIDQDLPETDPIQQQGAGQILVQMALQLHAFLGRRLGKDGVQKIANLSRVGGFEAGIQQ